MADVRTFCALRPPSSRAAEVIAPPYDVLTADEARELASRPHSFVRVTRPEGMMPEGTDAHSDAAYQQAKANLNALITDGALVHDKDAHYYVYGQKMGPHEQFGLIAAASVAEYDQGDIAKHEFTRPDKEDDRTHHMEVLDAQVGLVFLTYRATDALGAAFAQVTSADPDWQVTTEDDVVHTFWVVPSELNATFRDGFSAVPTLYIADGHHRSAAASRVHANREDDTSAFFLAGIFPDDALQVLAYNRVVDDLNGLAPDVFLEKVGNAFEISEGEPLPSARGTYSMYFQGAWHQLVPKEGVVDEDDPVARLDASVLQDHLLGPILGIDDPRRSERIGFVGGIRGHEALSEAVDAGAAVAFHLFPTGLDQLFEVADAGEVMPPKSTWFEPKLREGVVIREL